MHQNFLHISDVSLPGFLQSPFLLNLRKTQHLCCYKTGKKLLRPLSLCQMKTMAADCFIFPQYSTKTHTICIVEMWNSHIYRTLSQRGQCYCWFCKKEIMNQSTGCLVLWLQSNRTIELVKSKRECGRIICLHCQMLLFLPLHEQKKLVEENIFYSAFCHYQQKLLVVIYLLPALVLLTEGQTSLLDIP